MTLKQTCFLLFYGFICGFLEFPSSPKIFTAHHILRDMNFEWKSRICKGSCFDFAILSFTAAKKLVLMTYRFVENELRLSKIFTSSQPNIYGISLKELCSMLRSWFSKKITDVFLWAHADCVSFRPQRPCSHKTIGSHLKDIIFPFHFFRKKVTFVMRGTAMSPVWLKETRWVCIDKKYVLVTVGTRWCKIFFRTHHPTRISSVCQCVWTEKEKSS